MKHSLLFNIFKVALPAVAMSAMLAACVDDLGLGADKPSKLEQVYFTASIAEQDFFGEHKPQTRSAADERQRVMSSFYDLAIDGRSDIRLSVSTVDGMFGKATPIPEEGKENRKVRGCMLTELQQEPMTVMETAKTSDGKPLIGVPYSAYTDDGSSWGGSLIPHSTNVVSRTIRAIYPQSPFAMFSSDGTAIDYTTLPASSDQSDILFAQCEQTLGHTDKDSLHLTFDHLLTAVRFRVGSQQLPMSVIKNITIRGVAMKGTYDCQTRTWKVNAASKGTVKANLNFNVTGVENTVINGGENTFMLLPQQLDTDAKVTIEYEDYTADDEASWGTKTLTATLATAGTPRWEPGQCVTYTLMDHNESNEYILEVETPDDFTAAGGTQAVNVLSYRHVEGVRTPMRWLVQSYSSDGGKTWMSGGNSNPPKGLAISPIEGTSAEATPISVTLLPTDKTCAPHREFLRYRPILGYGTDGAFDLSTHDYLNQPCSRTTANCYVVDAPGKYRFPTAYGNAIVDGKTNSAAYTGQGTTFEGVDNSSTANFVDYRGSQVTAPMIRNNGITLSRATLVWEDAQDLICPDSIRLTPDGNAIEFTIEPEHIDQGNAVIAVMDGGGNVVWSWHIWVTDEKASLAEPIADKNKYGEAVDFMPLNLGWCSTYQALGHIGREAAVRITMPGHMTSRASFRLRQLSDTPVDQFNNVVGNSTYYNWGRKDPFPGAASTEVPIGASAANADCMPKRFYQAGRDAATLGLHAEMFVTYGPDYSKLFAAGAFVGINGYLTGLAVGKAINAYQATHAQVVGQNTIVGGASTGTAETEMIGREALKEGIQNGSVLTEEIASKLPEGYSVSAYGLAYENVADVNNLQTALNGFVIKNAAGRPIYFVQVEAESMLMEEEMLFLTLRPITMTSDIVVGPIGPWSKILLWNSVAAASVGANGGLMAVIEGASLFKGGTEWCREMKENGVSTSYAIQHPHVLLRDPRSWSRNPDIANLWNSSQTRIEDKNMKTVKTIYDPCPAGYCVPSARDFSALSDDNTSVFSSGSTLRNTDGGQALYFPGVGYRNFWSGANPGEEATNNINDQILFNGAQGFYWTASPTFDFSETDANSQPLRGAYSLNLRAIDSYDYYGDKEGTKYTPRVIPELPLQHSFALPIRPVREK